MGKQVSNKQFFSLFFLFWQQIDKNGQINWTKAKKKKKKKIQKQHIRQDLRCQCVLKNFPNKKKMKKNFKVKSGLTLTTSRTAT